MTTYDPEKITFFAKTDARGQDIAFGIKAKDRQRHMYVVGKTGMGKSTLLENMAAQDIQNGEGMAFIDPHGSAAETLLEYVPEHRVKDVVYFAPFDLNHPVSFNVMEDVGADKRHLVVSGLMSTFKKIWVDAWSARMEYILTNALLVLIEYPDTTLLSVNRLFIDKEFRKQVVEYCKDPAVKSFWTEEFASYTDRFAAEALPAIQNKIGQFTGNPLIRNIIGQPHSSFDIREIMDGKKILIMNLSKGLIGETNANLLGSMLTTRIYLAAMSRADLPVAQMRQMPNFYFYVDEFQSFANSTFANILSEARKYHLNLIIAHQYIAQMEEEVRDAVFGNVGTTIAFRVGPFDAEVLETVFAPRFEAVDLVNLGFAQIYLTLMIDGIGSQPFSAKTLPPVELPPISCREMVLDSSRKLYAKERATVEQVVADLHTPKRAESSGGARSTEQRQSGGNSQGSNNGSGGSGNTKDRRPSNAANDRPRNASNNDSRDRKQPESAKRTPDDLKAILAGMTKSNDRPNNSVSVSTESTKAPASKNASTKPTPKKPESKPEPKSDLKSALAAVLAQAQSGTKSTNDEKKSQTESVPKERPSEPPKRSEPSSITSDEKCTEKEERPVATENKQSESTPPAKEPSAPATPATPTTSPTPRPSVRTVMVEHRRRPGFAGSAAPPRPQSPQVPEQRPSERSAPQLDPNEIKRMLRQGENERSPFSS